MSRKGTTITFASILLVSLSLSGCSNNDKPEIDQKTSWGQIDTYLTKLSTNNTDLLISDLQKKYDTAVKLLEDSDGKTYDNNISRSSLSSYLPTVKKILEKDVDNNIDAQSDYRHTIQLSSTELMEKTNRVQSEFDTWNETREKILTEDEKKQKQEKESENSRKSLEDELKKKAEEQKQIELDREKLQQEREKQKKKDLDEEKTKQDTLERSVEITIKVKDNVSTVSGVKAINTKDVLNMKVGTVVKVVDDSSTIYKVDTFDTLGPTMGMIDVSGADIVFMFTDEDGNTTIATAKIQEL